MNHYLVITRKLKGNRGVPCSVKPFENNVSVAARCAGMQADLKQLRTKLTRKFPEFIEASFFIDLIDDDGNIIATESLE